MQSMKQLSKVDSSMVGLVGGKAASLGELITAGITVPPGFVITTEVYGKVISPKLKKAIFEGFDKLGAERVAVRSSAVAEDSASASWAGQLDTYLNVTKEGLIDAIQKCRASITSAHAREYADYNQVADSDRAVAVIVQAMVDSEVSGVLFTANPVTNNKDEIIIEAIYGLGEMIVQGLVTPDNWTISKQTGSVVSSSSRRQPKMLIYQSGKNRTVKIPDAKQQQPTLSHAQIQQLTQLAIQIEQHYSSPQDIEWAIAKNKLYVVQSRPITTLADSETSQKFTFEKLFTREESLMVSEIQYKQFAAWLSQITSESIPPTFFRITRGLLETWLCRESTQILVDAIYRHNITETDYLAQNVKLYRRLVVQMGKYETRGHARDLCELQQYLSLFGQIMIPLHVIFFTPFREDTPKPLIDLALKIRGEDAVFDNTDLYIKDSLAYIYPECNGIETFIGLKDLNNPDPDKLKQRENDFFCAENTYLNMDFEEFKVAYPQYSFMIDTFNPNQKSITGTTAFKGHVSGQVQIITRKKDINKFIAGNILVAPMTTPHYLPVMKQAIAFITDEGGVTCHAAIVSRELKTPCIIGTKIATQILHDGDRVEVDANEGLITIQERAEGARIKTNIPQSRLAKQPKLPPDVKYALTVPQSVLFTELSFQACRRPVLQKALSMDYEPDYLAIDTGGAMFWNYDNDKNFNTALIAGRPVEEALSGFVNSMAATARKLERRSTSLAAAQTRRARSRDDILEDLQDYWQAYMLHMTTLCSFWNVENLLARTITEELDQSGYDTETQGLDQFLKSKETNQYVRERRCFEKIVRRFADDHENLTEQNAAPELLAALCYHAREFGFLLTPFNLGKATSAIALLPRVNEVQQAFLQTSDTKASPAVIDFGDALTPKLQKLVDVLEQLTFWKNERIDVLSMADARIENLYQMAAESIGLSTDELFNMTSGELVSSLQAGQPTVDRAVLAERAVAFCLILRSGKIAFYQPSKVSNNDSSPTLGKISLLHGVASSAGIARGKVRLLRSLDEAKQLKTGEVLVTTMTRPEMGAALDRAIAFVTDEGGLLCHAAIISREMKKPCVIATAKATKVLKTGDLVEVDGTKGVVRIIKDAN
jgi:phosphoenolpyruvate synthase/pyruvate phosphate dikinase